MKKQTKTIFVSSDPSRAKADEKAYTEYDEFNRHQQIESDFDRQIKLLLDGGNA